MRIHDNEIVISPSSLTSRMECSEAHALRYADGNDGAPSLDFSRGKAAHSGSESYFLNRLANPKGDPLDPEVIELAQSAALAKLSEELDEAEQHLAVTFDPEEFDLWAKVIVKGIPEYIKLIGQHLRPVAVESKIRAKIGTIGGRSVILEGYADLMAEGMKDLPEFGIKNGGFYIIDLKTGMKKGAHITNKIQLLCYQVILELNGRHATTQVHKLIAKGPTKTMPDRAECQISIEPLPNKATPDRIEWLRELILGHVLCFLAGARSPDGITGFGCKGCAQRFNCRYYDGMEL